MKLSTRGRYGLRAMIDLGIYSQGGNIVSLSQIAQRQDISVNYLEQLISKLRKAGLIKGIRGAQGGYVLAMPLEEITIGDILRALEGDLDPVQCSEIKGDESCDNADLCVTKHVWKRISDSINDTVDNIMLLELVDESKRAHEKFEHPIDSPIRIC